MTKPTHIDIGTGKLGYRRLGAGPDIVFIHGWPLSRETWRDVAANLPTHTCHLIDLPGSGESMTAPDAELSLRNHVDAVIAAIEVLELEHTVLIGHDSGGLIARFVADRAPKKVSALVLVGTEIPFIHPPLIGRLQLVARIPGSASVMKGLINSPRLARSNQLLGSGFSNRDLIEGGFRTEVLDRTFRDSATVKRQLDLLASYTPDLVDELAQVHPRLKCPTLLIWGEQDPFFPVDKAREMASQFGGPTHFESIDNARLLVHEEHPEKVAALVRSFLPAVA